MKLEKREAAVREGIRSFESFVKGKDSYCNKVAMKCFLSSKLIATNQTLTTYMSLFIYFFKFFLFFPSDRGAVVIELLLNSLKLFVPALTPCHIHHRVVIT